MPPNSAALTSLLQQQQCQSIYNALDSGNTRQAIQHADNLLRNANAATSYPLARALKSLALYRLGRADEAFKEAEGVLSSPSASLDGSVLTPLTFVLSRSGQKERAADLLESASKQHPSDQTLAVKAFESLIAVPDYLRAQQLALRMYKSFGSSSKRAENSSRSSLYFWWSMECYLLLATQTPQAQGAQLALTLAERLIERHVASDQGRFDGKSAEDLRLYVAILAKQGKRKEALQLLTTSPGNTIVATSLALSQLYLDLLAESKEWQRLADYTRGKMADEGDRNWVTIEKWIEGVVGCEESARVDDALAFISQLAEKDIADGKRDFALAQIALVHAVQRKASSSSPPMVPLITRYFTTFQRKPSCYEDLAEYIDSLGPNDKTELAESEAIKSLDAAGGELARSFDSEHSVVACVNATKVRARLTRPSDGDGAETARRLLSTFYASLPTSAKQPKTVPRPGADLVLLAAQLVLTASAPDVPTLVALLAVLNHASIATPASYSLRLLALRIYLMLGNFALARKTWEEVKIRGIQNESLGWLWVSATNPRASSPLLSDSPAVSSPLTQWTKDALELYREGDVETLRSTNVAFERGNYSSIEQFCEVRERLRGSVQRQMIAVGGAAGGDGEEAKRVLQEYDAVVERGPREQWDRAVLPGWWAGLEGLVEATERAERGERSEASLRDNSDAKAAGRCSKSVATTASPLAMLRRATRTQRQLLQFASGQTVSVEKEDDVDGGDEPTTSRLLSRYLTSQDSAALAALLSHIESRLTSTSSPSPPLLPCEEYHLCSLLIDLQSALSRESQSEARKVVQEAMQRIAKEVYSSRAAPTFFDDDDKSTPSSSLSSSLLSLLREQKGGQGVLEKVVKDTREDMVKFHKRVGRVFASAGGEKA